MIQYKREQDGPPLLVHPDNNPAHLPWQIGSIVGSWALLTLIVLLCTFTFGRRLRRAAQTHPQSLAMEMIKPTVNRAYDTPAVNQYGPSPVSTVNTKATWPSPISPSKLTWGSLKGNKNRPSMHSIQSSVATFDETVIEDDKQKNLIEMERLYAAVMDHDDKNKSLPLVREQPVSPLAQHPPELQHLRGASQQKMPMSPPPIPMDPPSRTHTTSPKRSGRLSKPSPIQTNLSRKSSQGSSFRNLPISPPMGSPDMAPDSYRYYGEAEPLSPRHYTPRPPPTPPSQFQSPSQYHQEQPQSPTSISSPRRRGFPSSIRLSRASSKGGQNSPLQTPRTATQPQPPWPYTQAADDDDRIAPYNNAPTPERSQTPRSQKQKPAPLSLNTTGSAFTSTTTLPLRSAPLGLPLRQNSASTLQLPGGMTPMSPTNNISTTILERPVKGTAHLNHLRSPLTGVPQTPYSPYMPYTPLTPMTPSRLVTREERKRTKKEEGRRVLTEADRVVEEDEMWGM
ncbi:MAG: hypothetical protein MMC33_004961 [Icmadophila ericetorum]|nr:hypothetical protein [Icmadophila ericetorum]